MELNFAEIEKLMELMRKHGFNQLKVGGDKKSIELTYQAQGAAPVVTSVAAAQPQVPPPPHSQAGNVAKGFTAGHVIKSPFVGTFYRAASPGADPFVEIGARVRKGQALCIIEAMKLMNEIEADREGILREILVENGQPVEFDQALFVVE